MTTTQSAPTGQAGQMRGSGQIDPRGPQFNAILTSVVLALTLLTAPGTVGVVAARGPGRPVRDGVALGVQRTPAAYLFKTLVRPRLAAPGPPRGPAAARASPRASAWSSPWSASSATSPAPRCWASIATGFALAAALLNAVFGFCLGCEMYLLIRRVAPAASHRRVHSNA